MGRARIGTCSGPADVMVVRAAFEAHGIPVVIGAEQHAQLLGGHAGGLLSLDIWVDSDDAEDAVALLAELRNASTDYEFPDDGDAEEEAASSDVGHAIEVRRNTALAMILALCISFGTAHMYARAWKRGFALAAIEILGIWYLSHHVMIGSVLVGAAMIADLVGAVVAIRGAAPANAPELPRATVRRLPPPPS